MASIEKQVRDGKVTWQARYRDPAGRQRKRSLRQEGGRRAVPGDGARRRGARRLRRPLRPDHRRRVRPDVGRGAAAQAADGHGGSPASSTATSPGRRWARAASARSCRPMCRRGPPTAARCWHRPRCAASSRCSAASTPRRAGPAGGVVAGGAGDAAAPRAGPGGPADGRAGSRPGRRDAGAVPGDGADAGRARAADRRAAGAAGRGRGLPAAAGPHRVAVRARATVRRDPKTPRSQADAPAAGDRRRRAGRAHGGVPARRGRVAVHQRVRAAVPHPTTGRRSSAGPWPARRAARGTTSHASGTTTPACCWPLARVGRGRGAARATTTRSLVFSTYGHLMPDSEDRTRAAVDDAWCAPGVPRDDAAGL